VYFRHFILAILFLFASQAAYPTHQRAAEIVYIHLSGLTFGIYVISYTFTPSPANQYRSILPVNWGDGTTENIPRIQETLLPDDITYNLYYGEHTFPGPSTYVISIEDPNRNGGILNIPNSVNIPLFVQTELVINPFMGGYNNSVQLLMPPIDNGCALQPFYHNPGAYDKDGDSLSFKLVSCRGAQGLPIPGYTFPPATQSFSLDAVTGDLIWDSPPQQGEYNVAILIEEWRNKIKVGSVVRDMQIIIIACNNNPPSFDPVADTCVEAGQTLTLPVTARDIDGDSLLLFGSGGPMLVAVNPATLDPYPAVGKDSVTTFFQWQTTCDHVRKQPYQMIFKAIDNSTPVNLAAILSLWIEVVAPAPKGITATPIGNAIRLLWNPYSCPQASGFWIYRKADSTGYLPGYCETGVPAWLGYQKIAEVQGNSAVQYLDDNHGTGLVRGVQYCYMITAFFPDKAESYPSAEVCAELKKDLPVITHNSIRHTSNSTGSAYIAWSKPTELDTMQAPGPYVLKINRKTASGLPFIPIDSLPNLNDTVYFDTLLNTANDTLTYLIDLFNNTPGNRFYLGSTQPALSMFLNPVPTDEAALLSWSVDVPWQNKTYIIFRKDPGQISYDSIGFSQSNTYVDHGLVNGEAYCYFIQSIGSYSSSGFIDPIINYSQQACCIPVDNIPPCPPVLHIRTDCDLLENVLTWNPGADTCPSDVAGFYIYYAASWVPPDQLMLIDSVKNPADTVYIHHQPSTIIGCYAVTAVDSAGNESLPSNIICVDSYACPGYTLPNVFTPNGDGKNDVLEPFPYHSIESINLTIFNRWGTVVCSTADPDIQWDGKDKSTGRSCSEGTYFYVCLVKEQSLTGVATKTLKGTILILR